MHIIKSVVKSLLPRGSHYRRILFGPAAGAQMPIDFEYQTRLFLGIYERELWPYFRTLLRPGMRAFDIGGQDGYCALLINRLTGSEVVSFESDSGHMSRLEATLARNSPKLSAVHAFLGHPASASAMILDEASRRYFRPDFLKMDVEGMEADVLRGASETLESGPAMIIEVHGLEIEQQCLSILESFSYSVRTVDQSSRFANPGRSLAHNRWLICTRE